VKYLLFTLTLGAAAVMAVDSSPEAKAWWSHILVLADDNMEGRKAGTPGHSRAADYVAKQFAESGLKPGGTKGYLQPVQLIVRQIIEEQSELSLIHNGETKRLVLGDDALLSPRDASDRIIEAPAVFVGHGLRIPEMDIDDLNGIDLKGKIAVYISGAPKRVPGPLAAHAQSTQQRWSNLKKAGAIGAASISDPATREIPWERVKQTRTQPVLSFAESSLSESAGQHVLVLVNADRADAFFAGTPHTIKSLLESHRAGKTLPKFPLAARIRAKTAFSSRAAVSENVIGILPGSDAKLAKEYVALTAHLDHLGSGRPINGDGIYNGAMDNASGVATLIEAAKTLSKIKPKRSILIAAVTAEEGGLMGSKYFAAHPTVAAGQIVANINLDMFLPIIPLKGVTVYGFDESELGADFAALAKKFGIRAERDAEPHRNIFIRSDQYSFIRQGIPALAFKFYAGPGTAEEKVMREWLRNRYHGVADDINQPVNLEAAAKFNRILTEFAGSIANRETRPQWNAESFFRRYARQSAD
jgi:Zn-dependent M28 family amino/carboxypeptidase